MYREITVFFLKAEKDKIPNNITIQLLKSELNNMYGDITLKLVKADEIYLVSMCRDIAKTVKSRVKPTFALI